MLYLKLFLAFMFIACCLLLLINITIQNNFGFVFSLIVYFTLSFIGGIASNRMRDRELELRNKHET